ncbi:hypothetical protein WJX77_011437 [Trebouxia sp. C0004]
MKKRLLPGVGTRTGSESSFLFLLQLKEPAATAEGLSVTVSLVLLRETRKYWTSNYFTPSEHRSHSFTENDDLTLRQFCAELQQTHKVEMGLEVERQRIEQATMQQADQTDRVARQLRAKNDVLRNFCQAENETPDSLKTAVLSLWRFGMELAAQFKAFRALMGTQPAQTPEQAELSGACRLS